VTVRPTPAEVIAGVRRVLRDVVEPEVGSEYARSRLREVRAVLAQIDWDDATLTLRREWATRRSLLLEARTWLAAGTDRGSESGDLLSRLPDGGEPAAETFAQVAAGHAADGVLLVEVSATLARWTRERPGDTTARELRRRLATGLAG
jgi:hypothetical protein